MADRICRHPLRPVPHAPAWLSCDTCHADFLHREDCPGRGTERCIAFCMNAVPTPTVAELEALYDLPATEEPSR